MLKELGTVVIGADPKSEEADDSLDVKNIVELLEGDADKMLQDVRFVIGDYVSCAILPPLPNGEVAPPPARASGPRSQAPPRQNGFGGDFGGGFGGRRGSGRFEGGDRRGPSNVPPGEWRRGDVPPTHAGGEFPRGRGRGRGRGW
jgi:histone deacetylase complex subunit SAP18